MRIQSINIATAKVLDHLLRWAERVCPRHVGARSISQGGGRVCRQRIKGSRASASLAESCPVVLAYGSPLRGTARRHLGLAGPYGWRHGGIGLQVL